MPKHDYERLRSDSEELLDVQAYDVVKARLIHGEEEAIPAEFAHRILDGEVPVKVWREYRGMSVKELANQAEINATFLSQIENGQREGSVTTMKALARVLRLDLDDLV